MKIISSALRRPKVLPVRVNNIPERLRELDHCLLWRQELLNHKWLKVAGVLAATVATAYGLPKDARQDLEQEALFELWRKFPLFDPSLAQWCTFAEHVVTNRLRSLMRRQYAKCRGHRKQEPFHESVRSTPAREDGIDLKLDVRQVLAGVSQLDRAVALSLVDHSPTETSNRLHISRSSTYRSIGRLRGAFLSAGLGPRSMNYADAPTA